MELQIKATKPQAEFLSLAAKYRLFCGGYGSGKSEAMTVAAMIDACASAEILVGCYAPTYDLVRLITAPRISAKLAEYGVPHKHNKQDNIIYTSAPGWGDFVLRTMDNPERIVGYETFSAHCDELDTLKTEHARQAWNKVIARNRQKPRSLRVVDNQVSAYTTPEGFRFCHERWVTKASPLYAMVKAPSYSNPFLPEGYVQGLRESYSDQLVNAYIEGEFVNLAFSNVYSAFSRTKHHRDEVIEKNEPLYLGQDFNVGRMATTVYVKRGERFHAAAELVDLIDTPSLIQVLKERYAGHAITVYPDASGNSRKTADASKSDIALLRQAGFLLKVHSKNPFVKDRIAAVNQAFIRDLLTVNTNACPTVTQCLEQQSYDKNGEPDKTSGHDHMNDATGYPIAYEMPVNRPMFTPTGITMVR